MKYTKIVPLEVSRWFRLKFDIDKGYSYKFYWYMSKKVGGEKIWGCEVYKNSEICHNSTQASLQWFKDN